MIPREAILRETERALRRMLPAETPLGRWLREHLSEPLGRLLGRVFAALGLLAGTAFGWVLLVIVSGAAAALLCWLAILLYRSGQVAHRSRAGERTARSRTPSLDAAAQEEEAARLASAGRFAEAVRRLYLASFLRLNDRSGNPFDPSLTPGENLRPYRAAPFFPRLREFVARYQSVSFGRAPLDAAGYGEVADLRPPEASP